MQLSEELVSQSKLEWISVVVVVCLVSLKAREKATEIKRN